MRICYTKVPNFDHYQYILEKPYLLIIRSKNNQFLPHDFYCGQFDGNGNLDKTICIHNLNVDKIYGPWDGYAFSIRYLNKNIDDVYVITEKEYNLFKTCKTVKQIRILLDNLYEL